MSITLHVHTLGTARIDAAGMVILPAAAKRFGLLLYLAAHRPRQISRPFLEELLFPRLTEGNARHALRELIYELRHGGIPLVSDANGVTFGEGVDVHVDHEALSGSSRLTDSQVAAAAGGWLPDYQPIASESFTTWFEAHRADSVRAVLHALLAEIERSRAAGNWSRGERIARACLTLDQFNERAMIARVEMLALGGNRRDAISLLDGYLGELGPGAASMAPGMAGLRRRLATLAAVRPTSNVLPFMGREAEMTTVATALEAASAHGVRTVLLWGDSGIGKSRILDESAARVELEGGTVLRVSAHPHDLHRPMGVFADLVPKLMKQRGALGCSPASMVWLRRLVGDTPDVERTRRDDHADNVERIADQARLSEETAHAIARAVLDLLTAIACETRLVLIVDDAQWVDTASLSLIRDITRGRRPPDLSFLLAAHSDDRIRSLGNWGDHFVARRVNPLDSAVATRLLAGRLGDVGESEKPLVAWMVEAADGNPFFLDVLLTHFRTTGEPFTVPERLSTLIDQRVAGLSANAQAVLEAVVGLGRYATVDRLEKVLSIEGAGLVHAARELETGRFIAVTEPSTGRLQPFHWLIVESVQRYATPAAQRLLYRRIASHLEQEVARRADAATGGGSDSGLLWTCAEAWVVAGESAHAADLLITCASRAMRIGRATEAAELYLRAASLFPKGEMDELVETAIRVAAVVRESALVVRAAAMLGHRERSRSEESEIRLAILDARLQLEEDVVANINEIEAFSSDESITLPQRLEAARMLAILWHREILPERATAYRDVFRGLVLDAQPALLQAQLYCVIAYESIFGDQRIVPDLCRLLYDRTKQQRPDLFVEAATRAGFGLLRSGEVLEALDLFEQVYQVADRAELRSARSEMCMLLGSFRLDLDQPECTQRWLDRLKVHSEESARHAGREFAAAVISVELALYRGDIAAVQAITSRKEIYDRLGFALRARRWQTALGLLDAHLRGAAVDISSAEAELRRYHMEEFECGEPGDFETALTALLYRERGDAALARSRVLHYLHANRRPGFPLTPFLRQTARSVSLSEDEMQAILKGKRKQPRSVQHSLKLPAEWFRKRGNR